MYLDMECGESNNSPFLITLKFDLDYSIILYNVLVLYFYAPDTFLL